MSKMDEEEKLLIEACKNGLSAEVNRILSDMACETSDALDDLLGMLDDSEQPLEAVEKAEVVEKADKLALFWWGVQGALQNKAEGEISGRMFWPGVDDDE